MYSSSIKTFDTSTFMDLYPIQCGRAICPPSHQFGPTSTLNYLFHFVIEGKGVFTDTRTKQTLDIREGQGFLIPPNTPTSYKADDEEPWVYYWFEINGHKVSNLFKQCGLDYKHRIYQSNTQSILKEMVVPLDQLIDEPSENEALIMGRLYHQFALFYEHSANKPHSKYTSAKTLYLQQAIYYIKQNYHQPISLNDVANYVKISPQYLTKLFRMELSTSVSDYIIDTRMSRALVLLKETRFSIYEISERVGYKNQFYFSSAFKKRYHVSPSEWRKIYV